MSYRYLTRSYVEWLGAEIVPVAPSLNRGHWCGTDGCLSPPSLHRWGEGILHDDHLYVREPDGLAFERGAAL